MAPVFLSIFLAGLFLLLLFLLHFLKPELDPKWRMISEYEIGRFGWLMRLAFFAWGAGLLALLVALWPSLLPVSGLIARAWLIVIVIALFGAGIFKTDPITAPSQSLVNLLHTVCGAIVILTFPVAATLAVRSLLHDPRWAAQRSLPAFATGLAWFGLIAYFASIVISLRLDPESHALNGPTIYQGWPNRFLVVTYAAWIVLLAASALRL